MPSGRFFGMVIGGALPAALGADWLTSRLGPERRAARASRPPGRRSRRSPARWLLDLLGLPGGAAVGFVTGAHDGQLHLPRRRPRHGAASARARTSRRGLRRRPARSASSSARSGTPRSTCRCGSSASAPRTSYRPTSRAGSAPTRSRTRWRPDDGPTIVVLQAGNIHSGDFDPFAECVAVAHEHGAWVHVDGAFGLWAAASPRVARDAASGWPTPTRGRPTRTRR